MTYNKSSTEEALIEGCCRQNRQAQRFLYERLYGRMLVICLRYTSDKEQAQDVLNRAMLKVFDKIGDYKPTGSFTGWVARIVFRTSIDYVRSKTRYKQVIDFEAEREAEIAPEVTDSLIAEDLYRAVQELPTDIRTVFSLYVLDGYKHREIAEMLEISINTSKWHLSQGKKKMREILQRSYGYDERGRPKSSVSPARGSF